MSTANLAPERLAIVTGGSRGLGRALCLAWQAVGFTTLALSRTAAGPDTLAIDLSDPTASAAILRDRLSTIDTDALREFVFVGNAATIEPIGPAARHPAEALVRGLHVNLVSAIAVMAATVDVLQDCAARKVLAGLTSGAAQRAQAGLSLYGAAKAGMEQFLRCVALEQATQRHPFIAVSIDPGALDTDMQVRLRSAPVADYPSAPEFARRHTQGELADPAAVASALIAQLRSPALAAGSRLHARDAVPGAAR